MDCFSGNSPRSCVLHQSGATTAHPRKFKFVGAMKHEVLGVFWVHKAHVWSIYWKILTFAGKNLKIINISVIYVSLKFWPKMTKNRLKTKKLQQFWYVWCPFLRQNFNYQGLDCVTPLCWPKAKLFFVNLSSKTVKFKIFSSKYFHFAFFYSVMYLILLTKYISY